MTVSVNIQVAPAVQRRGPNIGPKESQHSRDERSRKRKSRSKTRKTVQIGKATRKRSSKKAKRRMSFEKEWFTELDVQMNGNMTTENRSLDLASWSFWLTLSRTTEWGRELYSNCKRKEKSMGQLSKKYGCEGKQGKRRRERTAGLSEGFSFYFIAKSWIC